MSFPLDAEFTVIMYFHDDCLACLDAADEAVTMAKVTGSTGAKVERATAVATDEHQGRSLRDRATHKLARTGSNTVAQPATLHMSDQTEEKP